jgi:hypothetical protein
VAFEINRFKAEGLKQGGARPSQFSVNIAFPFASNDARRLEFLCRAASSPPSILDHIDVFYFGRSVKMAGDRQFMDWEITIMNDEDFALRRLFLNWSNRVNMHISNVMDKSIFPLGYKVNGDVTQFGKSGNIIERYAFQGLWPKVVDGMPLDWSQQNQIQEFNVTLAYDLWVPGDGPTATAPGQFNPLASVDGTSS